jgi:hypothetical protein
MVCLLCIDASRKAYIKNKRKLDMLDEGRAVAGGSNSKIRRIDNLKPVNQVCELTYGGAVHMCLFLLLYCFLSFLHVMMKFMRGIVRYCKLRFQFFSAFISKNVKMLGLYQF